MRKWEKKEVVDGLLLGEVKPEELSHILWDHFLHVYFQFHFAYSKTTYQSASQK